MPEPALHAATAFDPAATAAAGLSPAPEAPIPVLAITGLSLAAMASGISMRVTDALLPRLADDFGIALGQAAQVITVFAVAYGLSQLLFGPLGDRYGKYRVIAAACGASALTSLLCALAPGLPALLAGRLAAGATAAAVIPLSMAWIGDVVPYARRQEVLARYLIGQIGGFAAGVWLGGYAAEHLHWRTPFFVIAAVFALVALMLQVLRRRLPPAALQPPVPPPSSISADARPSRRSPWRAMAGEFGAVLARPWARLVLTTVACEGAAFFGAFAFIAAHLHQRFGLPLSTVGALVMLYGLGGIGFALFARQLVRLLEQRLLVHWGAALMAASLLALAVAPVWWLAPPVCAMMGMGFYMMHNTLQTEATQMAPERRGAAVAAFASCFFLGQSAGVAIGGLLVGAIGTGGWLAVGAAGVCATAWRFNRRREALREQPGFA